MKAEGEADYFDITTKDAYDPMEWALLPELAQKHRLKLWRLYELSRLGHLPIKMIAGRPVKPYLVDVAAFEALVSTAQARQPRSLKTERKSKPSRRRKELLW